MSNLDLCHHVKKKRKTQNRCISVNLGNEATWFGSRKHNVTYMTEVECKTFDTALSPGAKHLFNLLSPRLGSC